MTGERIYEWPRRTSRRQHIVGWLGWYALVVMIVLAGLVIRALT